MGQKVNPTGIRLGISKDWNSRWYASSKEFPGFIEADFRAREFLRKELANAAVSKIQITRPSKSAQVTIFTARPGVVIGKKGEDIDKLRIQLTKIMGCPVHVAIEEIKKPELDAYLVAEGIAQQLERRVMFRRAMKRAVTNTMKVGAEGIRVNVSGRLNGAEIARMEWYREGRVPLHTLRANIDYGTAEALTTYGILGIKVWIYKGEVFDYQKADEQPEKGRRSKKRGE